MTGPVTEKLDAQGVLQPGESGYWKVWGASASHIRTGDLLMLKWSDDEIHEYEVAEVDATQVWPIRVTAVSGERFWVGALQPIILLRMGTHNTLAEEVR